MSELEEDNEFIATNLYSTDEQIIAPYSHRFHLSAARLVGESAASKKPEPQLQLEVLEDDKLLAQFKSNTDNRTIIVSEPSYNDAMLWRIHDIYRTDGACRRCIDTMVEFTIGRRRTSVVLDVNDYFDSEEDEQATLDEIQNNDLYRKYVRGISKINRRLNLHEFQKTLLTSALVYGKGAILIEFDDDPLSNDQAMPIALKSLNSLRIGRVFYYEDDWTLAGIEYLDFKDKIIEPHKLIYMVNKDHHISPRTLFHGISALEPVIDIAETNIINHQTNIKEINRRLWASFLIVKYMGKKKSDITKFKKGYKPGQAIISNRDFEAQVVDVKHDLEKLLEQMDKSDLKIARDLSIPSLLSGFDQNQAQATAGTVVNSWMNSSIDSKRTEMRNVFEAQWLNRILARLIAINGDSIESLIAALKNIPPQQTEKPLPLDPNMPTAAKPPSNRRGPIEDIKLTTIPAEEQELDVIDLPFKIKLLFVNIPTATLLDTAATVIGLHKDGILDLQLALEELDRKQYIPRMTLVEAQNKAMQQAMFEQGLLKQQQEPKPPGAQQQDKNTEMGPDAGSKVDNMLASKLNLSNRSSKSQSTGSNKQLRSL